jgi:hypothetical protein
MNLRSVPFLTSRSTAKNSTQSPLLRLPAELRNKIWDYAYGNSVVNVNRVMYIGKDLSYTSCQEHGVGQDRTNCHGKKCSKPVKVPMVSKQFWYEAVAAFLESNTFEFDNPHALRKFAMSGLPHVAGIRRISIRSSDGLAYALDYWRKAWAASVVEQMGGLRGVDLQLGLHHHDARELQKSIMKRPYGRLGNVPKMIRSFQQHQLNDRHTTVNLVEFRWERGPTPNTSYHTLAEAIRVELLDHHPRRLSTRERKTDGV